MIPCPVCGARAWTVFLDQPGIPVHCNRLWTSAEEARKAPRGEMRLGACGDCGHVYNLAFDPSLVEYAPGYENAQHFSPHFRRYLEGLAEELVSRHGLAGKDIVEIGCGDGTFLSLLCAGGRNRGVGFDPAAPAEGERRNGIRIIRGFYGEDHADLPADLICCRHILEHLARPVEFLGAVRRTLGDRLDAAVYLEVPDGRFTFERQGIWDLLYEHCSYFTEPSLARLLRESGFEPVEIRSSFEGQFLSAHARPARRAERAARTPASASLTSFAALFREKVGQWRERVAQWSAEGRRAAVWGAGTKGVMFLNLVGGEGITVVDINPRKQGCFVAGTGHAIFSPERLREEVPNVILVMNPAYKDEIRRQFERWGLSPDLEVV